MSAAAQRRPVPNKPGCWYFVETVACPICGAETVYRERRPPPRPAFDSERYDFSEGSACSDHFL